MESGLVLTDFVAREETQLTVITGEILKIKIIPKSKWCYAYSKSSQGYVPLNFIKIINRYERINLDNDQDLRLKLTSTSASNYVAQDNNRISSNDTGSSHFKLLAIASVGTIIGFIFLVGALYFYFKFKKNRNSSYDAFKSRDRHEPMELTNLNNSEPNASLPFYVINEDLKTVENQGPLPMSVINSYGLECDLCKDVLKDDNAMKKHMLKKHINEFKEKFSRARVYKY